MGVRFKAIGEKSSDKKNNQKERELLKGIKFKQSYKANVRNPSGRDMRRAIRKV